MKINCNVADDLLPLYLDGACSDDSKKLLDEHLQECRTCREKSERMQSQNVEPQLKIDESHVSMAAYAKKVKRYRLRLALFVILATAIAAFIISVCYLAVKDMRAQTEPYVYDVGSAVYNLTAGELTATTEEISQYMFYTNYEQIKVSVQAEGEHYGRVMLWNTEYDEDFILVSDVSASEPTCTFTGLSSSNRYRVTYDGAEGATITVSEGREVSFWMSLRTVLREMVMFLGGY